MNKIFALAVFFCVCCCPLQVWAGVISLETTTSCLYTERGLRVEVRLKNAGDEAAANVRVNARFEDLEKSSPVKPEIAPGGTYTARMMMSPDIRTPGVYALSVQVDFHDLSGHPFSALASGLFAYREAVNSLVYAERGRMTLPGEGDLVVPVINSDDKNHKVRVRLSVPREFTAEPAERTVEVNGRDKGRAKFRLTNFSAMDRARYPVMVYLDYESEGRHFATVSEYLVLVAQPDDLFKEYRTILLIIGGLLILAVILFQLVRRSRGRASSQDRPS